MSPVRFEPTISAGERPKTYALDRAATGAGRFIQVSTFKYCGSFTCSQEPVTGLSPESVHFTQTTGVTLLRALGAEGQNPSWVLFVCLFVCFLGVTTLCCVFHSSVAGFSLLILEAS
jgi:hypothetical protein